MLQSFTYCQIEFGRGLQKNNCLKQLFDTSYDSYSNHFVKELKTLGYIQTDFHDLK